VPNIHSVNKITLPTRCHGRYQGDHLPEAFAFFDLAGVPAISPAPIGFELYAILFTFRGPLLFALQDIVNTDGIYPVTRMTSLSRSDQKL